MRAWIAAAGATVVFATVVHAQTPRSMLNAGGVAPSNAAASAVNPWLGAQLNIKFGNSDDLANSLLVAAKVLTEIDFGTDAFKLPVMGNLANLKSAAGDGNVTAEEENEDKIQTLLSASEGIHVGLYPYYYLADKEVVYLVLHGVTGWKVNAFQDSVTKDYTYLNQGRIGFGLEVGLGKRADSSKRLTISISPGWTIVAPDAYEKVFGERRTAINSTEITGVVPIGSNMGLLIESILSNDVKSSFRVGILVQTEVK